tara:strand:+ start:4063 stop:4638 length:576 start_codon:yes stop_codon:yes gene_type:complete
MTQDAKILFRWFILVLICSSIGVLIIFRDVKKGFGTITFGKFPEFNLTDQFSNRINLEELSKGPWIGNFITKDCQKSEDCSELLRVNSSIQQKLNDYSNVQIVTFQNKNLSNEYLSILNDFNSILTKWKLLSGDDEYINLLAERILNQNLPESKINELLFLVDQNGIIRGYYQVVNEFEISKLIDDVKKLI